MTSNANVPNPKIPIGTINIPAPLLEPLPPDEEDELDDAEGEWTEPLRAVPLPAAPLAPNVVWKCVPLCFILSLALVMALK